MLGVAPYFLIHARGSALFLSHGRGGAFFSQVMVGVLPCFLRHGRGGALVPYFLSHGSGGALFSQLRVITPEYDLDEVSFAQPRPILGIGFLRYVQ